MNTNPIQTSHLYPNQESGFHLIPYFIGSDTGRTIEEANGYLIISYLDTFEIPRLTYQRFHAFTNYEEKWFHTTFSDIIPDIEKYHKVKSESKHPFGGLDRDIKYIEEE